MQTRAQSPRRVKPTTTWLYLLAFCIEVDVEDKKTPKVMVSNSIDFRPNDFSDDWRWGDDFDSDDELGTFTEFFEHNTSGNGNATMVDVLETEETMEFVNVRSIAEEFARTYGLQHHCQK